MKVLQADLADAEQFSADYQTDSEWGWARQSTKTFSSSMIRRSRGMFRSIVGWRRCHSNAKALRSKPSGQSSVETNE